MKTLSSLAFLAVAVSLVACDGGLTISRTVAIKDASAVSPKKHKCESVMVLPPTGSERGEATALATLERAFMKRGVRVISSGVTGRVVVEESENGKHTGGARDLSDLERALVLARRSNADALVQVGELKWVIGERYFVSHGPKTTDADEVGSREELLAAPEAKRIVLQSPRLRFVGKVIDVESGEIVASVEVSRGVADALVPAAYKPNSARIYSSDSGPTREFLAQELMDKLADIVAKGDDKPVAAEPPPPPPPPPAAEPKKAKK